MNLVILTMASSSGAGNVLGDASILRVFRLMRLTRLLRMARLIRMVPELLIMVKAVASAARSVGFTLILLGICLYVFAIAFRAVLDGTTVGWDFFRNVPMSMHSLAMHGTLLDRVSDIMEFLRDDSPVGFALMYIFIIMSAVTIMNMLIGVLCEVITAVAEAEREALQVSWTTEVLQQCRGDAQRLKLTKRTCAMMHQYAPMISTVTISVATSNYIAHHCTSLHNIIWNSEEFCFALQACAWNSMFSIATRPCESLGPDF